YEYGDIESYDDELETTVPLQTVRKLCAVLDLKLGHILHIPDFDATQYPIGNPSQTIKRARKRLGYSSSHLAEREGFEESVINSLETDPPFAETVTILLLYDLEHILGMPKGALVLANWESR